MTYLNPKTIPVPAQNSANNAYIQDVVGNKTDTGAGDSIYSLLHIAEEHDHSASKVYPTLANTPDIDTPASIWTLGGFVEIVPANTITSIFDIHHINIEEVSTTGVYEVVLYSGLASSEVEIGRVRFAKTTNLAAVSSQPFQTIRLPANTRISAKSASSNSSSDTVGISIFYHTY
jgi:hypothetical protein